VCGATLRHKLKNSVGFPCLADEAKVIMEGPRSWNSSVRKMTEMKMAFGCERRERHCIAKRVAAMVSLLRSPSNPLLQDLVDVGCRCANLNHCELADACGAIHRAFLPVETASRAKPSVV
jgi:hypothetical protein